MFKFLELNMRDKNSFIDRLLISRLTSPTQTFTHSTIAERGLFSRNAWNEIRLYVIACLCLIYRYISYLILAILNKGMHCIWRVPLLSSVFSLYSETLGTFLLALESESAILPLLLFDAELPLLCNLHVVVFEPNEVLTISPI